MSSFKKINHPLTIRKVRGKLIVNVNGANEPITVIRQTRHNELEVHMRNGSTFVEKFSLAEVQHGQHFQAILGMVGMREYLVFFNVKFSFKDVPCAGKVFLRSTEEQIDYVNDLVKSCYPQNSYVDKYATLINPAKIESVGEDVFQFHMTTSIMCRDEDIDKMVELLTLLCFNDSDSSVVALLLDQEQTLESFKAAQDPQEKLSYYLTDTEKFVNRLSFINGTVFYSDPPA